MLNAELAVFVAKRDRVVIAYSDSHLKKQNLATTGEIVWALNPYADENT